MLAWAGSPGPVAGGSHGGPHSAGWAPRELLSLISVPGDPGSTGRLYTPECRVQALCLLSHRVCQGESSGVAALILTLQGGMGPTEVNRPRSWLSSSCRSGLKISPSLRGEQLLRLLSEAGRRAGRPSLRLGGLLCGEESEWPTLVRALRAGPLVSSLSPRGLDLQGVGHGVPSGAGGSGPWGRRGPGRCAHCLLCPQYDNLLSQFGCMQVSASSSHSLSSVDVGLPQRAGSNIEQYIHDLDTNSFELDLQFSEDEKRLLLEKQASGNPW